MRVVGSHEDRYLERLNETIASIEEAEMPPDDGTEDDEPSTPPHEYMVLAEKRLRLMRDIVSHIASAQGHPSPESLGDDLFRCVVSEAIDATEEWAEGPGMDPDDRGDGPTRPSDTELQRLLREHYDLGERMMSIVDESLPESGGLDDD